MDIKKLMFLGAIAIIVIAVLIIPQSPVKILGMQSPMGIGIYVKRSNGSPVNGATISTAGMTAVTNDKGMGALVPMGDIGSTFTINAAYNGMTGSAYLVITSLTPQVVNIVLQTKTDFTYSPSTPRPDETITFTDTSTGPIVSYEWTFGDVAAISNQKNPTHSYPRDGAYTVTHTVRDDIGLRTVTKIITVATPVLTVKTTPSSCSVTVGEITKDSGTTGASFTLVAGTYSISVSKTGYVTQTRTTIISYAKTETFTLSTTPPDYYTLTVITKQKDCSVSVCKYLVLPQGEGSLSCEPPKSSGNGSIQYPSMTAGKYTVSAGKEGYLYKTMVVELTGNKVIEIDLSQEQTQPQNIWTYIFIGAFIASFILILVVIIRKKKK